MQGRTRPILRMIARLQDPAAREASPFLFLVAVVLALLLAILEVDLNSAGLQSLGLMGNAFSADPVFKSP